MPIDRHDITQILLKVGLNTLTLTLINTNQRYWGSALLVQLYVAARILLTWGSYMHDWIISIRVEVWRNRTSLIPPLFIEVPVPSQESGWSCISDNGIDFSSLYDFSLRFGNGSDSELFLVYHCIPVTSRNSDYHRRINIFIITRNLLRIHLLGLYHPLTCRER